MLARFLVLPLIFSLVAAAQAPAPASNWDHVKMLSAGIEVRVVAGASKPVVGGLESVTDGELVLRLAGGPQSIPRPSILSVSIERKDHRLRNALIGLGVGTLAGAGIGAIAGRAQENNCNQFLCNSLDVPAGAAVGGVIGLLSGTLAGVFWPTGGWRKIYVP
jgi:hypothetical protein